MRLLLNFFAFIFFVYLSFTLSYWYLTLAFWFAFNTFRLYEIRRLRRIRDEINIFTEQGRLVVKGINKKIDMWNGHFSSRNR